MSTRPIILLDFNNCAWRSAHALKRQEMTYNGKPTTIVYGILAEVGRVMERFGSNLIVMCGDHPDGPTLRKKLFPEYKAKRTEDLSEEDKEFRKTVAAGMTMFRKGLRQAGYQGYVHAAGYEADDLIAAYRHVYDGEDIVIVTTDKDVYQLIDDKVRIYRPGAKPLIMTLQQFHQDYQGIKPSEWITVKSLAGCSSDNVPGLSGVGELTAIKYVKGLLTAESKVNQRIKEHIFLRGGNPAFQRDRRLVRIPFNVQLLDAVEASIDDIYTYAVPEFTEKHWLAVCRRFGIKKLPYPRC